MGAHVECSRMRADELAACERILAASFEQAIERDVARSLGADVWVAREAGVVRGLVAVRDRRAGFGGRLVPVACLSSLCVEERERARGLGSELVTSALQAAAARGIGAALLIPRSEGFHERLGFGRCGARFTCAFDLPRATAPPGAGTVRPFARGDEAEWLDLAARTARERTGVVVPTADDRARRSRAPRRAYVVERDGAIVASITVSERVEKDHSTLYVHDLLALDRGASEAVWTFVTRFVPHARDVRWRAAPLDPLADFALRSGARFEARGSWMLRLVDVRRFLVERGFAPACAGELSFALEDPLLPANEQPFTLVVQAGRGRVHAGGPGTIRADSASFAQLCAGARSASQLRAAGRLVAPATELERIDALFALPPSMLQSLP